MEPTVVQKGTTSCPAIIRRVRVRYGDRVRVRVRVSIVVVLS
jgi:hypothetical protein